MSECCCVCAYSQVQTMSSLFGVVFSGECTSGAFPSWPIKDSGEQVVNPALMVSKAVSQLQSFP